MRAPQPLQAALSMVAAALCFSLMGAAVRRASDWYAPAEIVAYRGLLGMLVMALVLRASGIGIRTSRGGMHAWRSISGVTALVLWFHALAALPLATAMTMNYMSSIWIAAWTLLAALVVHRRARRPKTPSPAAAPPFDPVLLAAVLAGFGGVVLVLQPGGAPAAAGGHRPGAVLAGLASGVLSAVAYLQVRTLGRLGEPEARTVFFFSAASGLVGMALQGFGGGWHRHDAESALWLVAVGALATGGQWTLTRAYAVGHPVVNATLNYLGIVFAFVWAQVGFGERASVAQVGGAALIIVAGIAAARRGTAGAPRPGPLVADQGRDADHRTRGPSTT